MEKEIDKKLKEISELKKEWFELFNSLDKSVEKVNGFVNYKHHVIRRKAKAMQSDDFHWTEEKFQKLADFFNGFIK